MVLGASPFCFQKGQESPSKGYHKALKATKKLQKPPKKPETQDLPDPQLKMRSFRTEIDGCGRPSILPPKGPGKPQEAKTYQKAFKATKKLQKASQQAGKHRICQTRNKKCDIQ